MQLSGVFFGFPLRSHIVPSLSIVRELRNRGTHIKYYSTSMFRSLIESAGAEYAEYPSPCATLGDPIRLAGHIERVVDVTAHILSQLFSDIEANERPSFIMFDSQALWGRIIARELGTISVASITTFAFTRWMLQVLGQDPEGGRLDGPQLTEKLAKLTRSYVRDSADVIAATGDLNIVFTSRFFQPGGRFFDDSYMFVGPLLDRRPHDGVRVASSESRPLAYLSFGTVFVDDVEQLQRISRILAAAGWEVVVSLGAADKKVSGEWGPHVKVHPFVDQRTVLAQAQLFVTHGGMGSVSEALPHGVPLIVVPQGSDQYLVGRRLAALGAAVVLDGDSSADQWQAALARIKAGPASFAAASARIEHSFADVLTVTSVVDRLSALIEAQ